LGHLQAFQDIAIANRGPDGHPSRNSGELGYDTTDRRTRGQVSRGVVGPNYPP
jgi:hypothetical protein